MWLPLVGSDPIDHICCSLKYISPSQNDSMPFSQNQTSKKTNAEDCKYVERILKYLEFSGECFVQV